MADIGSTIDCSTLDTGRPLALVTGGGSGIGLAIVEDLARDREVIALGRSEAKLRALVGRPHIHPVAVDLCDGVALARLTAPLARLDVLVHCAAISAWSSLETSSLPAWRETFETNVYAPAELTRLLLPALRTAKGQVVFISSGAAVKAVPGHIVYSASKFALRGVADALRIEEVGAGIRVATVAPGPTETPMNRATRTARTGSAAREEGRYSDPESHAAAVRLVVDMSPDSQVTEVVVRPRLL
ncbi:SDR family oxidoreductase [Roseomonas sp. CAU 1739]|uniref:SDR family oxidoreductase n=1 Tax=Roseomonas sp. CAU 1739 TaxID=3140364 RepID=UPI00325C15D5